VVEPTSIFAIIRIPPTPYLSDLHLWHVATSSAMAEPFDVDQFTERCRDQLGFPPKPFQTAATKAIHEGKDTVLIAPAGAGKSYLFRSLSLAPGVSKKAMTLIISPLMALQKEQAEK
jgi:ATP-dependent helicase YprA (DUF1998 family)